MAKKAGFEVTATRPVCVDFRDGRSISFRPGQRFEATLTNSSVLRLLRIRDVRKLGAYEKVRPLPVKLGAPRREQNIMKARSKIEQAKKVALAKLEASKKAPPKIEVAKPAPLPKTSPAKTSSKTSSKSKPKPKPQSSEDK